MKNLIKNNKGNASLILLAIMTVIMGFGMLTIGNYLYFAIASNADAGTKIAVQGQYATNTFTFTGNGTTGQAIYINNTGGTPGCYYINTTGIGKPVGCLVIGYGGGVERNNSYQLAVNLTNQINADPDISLLFSATNPANNTTVIVAKSHGVAANSYVTADTVTNGSWASGTPLGGVDDVTGQASQNTLNNYVEIVFPVFGLALMILGFSVILYTVRGSLGGNMGRQ